MTHDQALLEFLRALVGDGASRARFSADPAAALAAGGIVATSPQDIHDALVRIGDDEDLAQGFGGGSGRGRTRGTDVLHVPPPPPPEYFSEYDSQGGAVRYLDNYVSSNFDDDLGPFTGSSAEHAAEDESMLGSHVTDGGRLDGGGYVTDDGSHDHGDRTADGTDEVRHDYGDRTAAGTDSDQHNLDQHNLDQHNLDQHNLDQHGVFDPGGI